MALRRDLRVAMFSFRRILNRHDGVLPAEFNFLALGRDHCGFLIRVIVNCAVSLESRAVQVGGRNYFVAVETGLHQVQRSLDCRVGLLCHLRPVLNVRIHHE